MPNCRFCQKPLDHVFINLGFQPPSNSFLTQAQLEEPETYYPLKVFVCDFCFLVQIPEVKKASEIFKDDYPYYSSQSPSNVTHAKEYVEMMCQRFQIGPGKRVLEIGSNDGYLLQWFKEKGIRVQGVEPARGPCRVSILKGIPTAPHFFSAGLMRRMHVTYGVFDLICGINVIAHQSDINDFVEGLKIALAPKGIITMEFPHLMNLVEYGQFDTIYHEHFSYFSFATICEIFHKHGIAVFDVDEIPEHGGSLRIYARHESGDSLSEKVPMLLHKERDKGMLDIEYYADFHTGIENNKRDLLAFLIAEKERGKVIVGYGAAAKGNTLLNYMGLRTDLIPYVVDRSPAKQGKYLPGSHIPVVNEERIREDQPDYVLILPWNLKEEIMEQLSYVREWGGKFIVPIPDMGVI